LFTNITTLIDGDKTTYTVHELITWTMINKDVSGKSQPQHVHTSSCVPYRNNPFH